MVYIMYTSVLMYMSVYMYTICNDGYDCIHVYVCIHHVFLVPKETRGGGLDSLTLEVYMVVSYSMSAGN